MADLSLRHLWLVAGREYRVRVGARGFILSTIAAPLILALLVLLPLIVGAVSKPAGERKRVEILCGDRALAGLISAELARDPVPGRRIEADFDSSPGARRRLARRLAESAIGAYLVVPDDAIATGQVDYYAAGSAEYYLYSHLRRVLAAALAAARLARRGMAPAEVERVLRPVEIQFFFSGKQPGRADYFSGDLGVLALAYVLLFSFISYGAMVMQSVSEEKLSRIAELLLVSTRPEELMAGKIVGVGAVGLTQVAIWLGLGAALAILLPGARAALASLHLSARLAAYFALFYLLGYLLFSVLYAVAGVSGDGMPRTPQWTALIVAPVVAALILLPAVSAAPDSTLALAGSMVPYLAPILMYARIAAGAPPAWQIALSLALMVATIGLTTIACARIYRVAILMYGKRPSLREVARWLRYA